MDSDPNDDVTEKSKNSKKEDYSLLSKQIVEISSKLDTIILLLSRGGNFAVNQSASVYIPSLNAEGLNSNISDIKKQIGSSDLHDSVEKLRILDKTNM